MTHLETVQFMYQSFATRQQFPAIIEHLARRRRMEHDALDHGIPYLRPGRGRAHVGAFSTFSATISPSSASTS